MFSIESHSQCQTAIDKSINTVFFIEMIDAERQRFYHRYFQTFLALHILQRLILMLSLVHWICTSSVLFVQDLVIVLYVKWLRVLRIDIDSSHVFLWIQQRRWGKFMLTSIYNEFKKFMGIWFILLN